MNGERFASLTEDQQQIMRDAAATIADDQRTVIRDEDANNVAYLCEHGMTLALATDDEIASLRSAVQPVYDEIASDPENAAWLNQIEALKDEVDAPVATTECPQTEATVEVEAGAFPEGTFVHTVTDEDFEKVCGGEIDDFESTEYAVFEDGRLEHLIPHEDGTVEIGFKATYTVVRDRVEILELGTSTPASYHWTFDGTQLVLSDLADDFGDCTHHGVWESHPWVLVEDDAISGSQFPEATFHSSVDRTDFERFCENIPDMPELEGAALEIIIGDDRVEMWETFSDGSRELGFKADVIVVRDRVEFRESPDAAEGLSLRWSFDGTTLTFSDIRNDNGECVHHVMWESNPWVLAEPSTPETTEAT